MTAAKATLPQVTDQTAPEGTRGGSGTRTRARTERPPRCGRPKSENGYPCRRAAGANTDHPGFGPCALHDDGSWAMPPFAENVEAREAFLEAVRADRYAGLRSLIGPLGYHRSDVTALLDADPAFEADYVEARGYDNDTLRTELAKRAIDGKSDRLLEFEAKMRLPEGQALQRHRVDGRLEVTAFDVRLAFEPVFDGAPPSLEEPPAELEP